MTLPSNWNWRLIEYWWGNDVDCYTIHSVWWTEDGEPHGYTDDPEHAMGRSADEVLMELAALARDIRMHPEPVAIIERDKNRWKWLVGKDQEWQVYEDGA